MVSKFPEAISENLTNFFQDLLNRGFDYAIQEIHPTSIHDFTNFFLELSETYSKISSSDTNPNQPIFNAILNFFRQDNWQFQRLKLEPVLLIPFQGINGKWNCYAKAREIQKHFVFYSICPIKAPESKREAIAEFIARVNYDMIIGNFELDFSVGEIRYKTSVDVKDERLSFNSIKHLVYTNVNMMDKYLPGIISVINDEVLPVSAINQIELISNITQSLEEEQLLVVASNQEELAVSPSSQTDLQEQEKRPDRDSHILAILTPEEIAQFHQVSQMVAPYQRKQVQGINEKLKSGILLRLGDLGEEVFVRADNFFGEVNLSAKNLKLIQRYSGLAGRIRLLWQYLNNWNEQHGEILVNSQERTILVDLDNLFWCIDGRLQKLIIDELKGRNEVEVLIEIEEFREKLGVYEKFVKQISCSSPKTASE
ncbi:hypothetical protein NIES4074_40570 [Cylindrospermum sp. NIES-4074]|nr:hypothetical protein NIES4074_40570 [Cylindrospermum sp. NIES-4074]